MRRTRAQDTDANLPGGRDSRVQASRVSAEENTMEEQRAPGRSSGGNARGGRRSSRGREGGTSWAERYREGRREHPALDRGREPDAARRGAEVVWRRTSGGMATDTTNRRKLKSARATGEVERSSGSCQRHRTHSEEGLLDTAGRQGEKAESLWTGKGSAEKAPSGPGRGGEALGTTRLRGWGHLSGLSHTIFGTLVLLGGCIALETHTHTQSLVDGKESLRELLFPATESVRPPATARQQVYLRCWGHFQIRPRTWLNTGANENADPRKPPASTKN